MENLIPLIETISGLLKNKEEDNLVLSLMFHDAQSNPEKADPSLLSLLKEVRKYPELSIFDGQMQVFGNSAVRVDYNFLVHWLIKRTSVVGAQQAIHNLKKYISSNEIPLLEIIAIAGFNANKVCDLENGIKLIPWDQFPGSHQKDYILKKFMHGTPFHFPNSILSKEKIVNLL